MTAALLALLLQAPEEFKVKLETSKGDILLRVVRAWAPRGVDRFHELVKAGYYDDVRFYRVVPKFVAQFGLNGDPKVTAKWRESKILDDPVVKKNVRGTLAFAKGEPNARTTNVFFNLKDNAALDRSGFAPFAEVIDGMEVVDVLHAGSPSQKRVVEEGNAYLDKDYRDLDRVKAARVVE